jgi:hypothetical protein
MMKGKDKCLPIRILSYGVQAASQFQANPYNWRLHPQHQRDVLRASLNSFGWIDAVIVNRRTGHILDGHARIEEALRLGEDTPVPYIEVDLSEEEERQVLAVKDPIAALAEADPFKFAELIDEIQPADEELAKFIGELAAETGANLLTEDDADVDAGALADAMPNKAFELTVRFADWKAVEAFARLVKQEITPKTKYIWYPREP